MSCAQIARVFFARAIFYVSGFSLYPVTVSANGIRASFFLLAVRQSISLPIFHVLLEILRYAQNDKLGVVGV